MSFFDSNQDFFYDFFEKKITVEHILYYLNLNLILINPDSSNYLEKHTIKNYTIFFETLKHRTPEHLKESLYPIYEQAKVDFIIQALNGKPNIDSFFNLSLFFSSETRDFIESIFVKMIKNHTLFSNNMSQLLLFIDKYNFNDVLFNSIKNNYIDFIFCEFKEHLSEFVSKIKHNFLEQNTKFFLIYKEELLNCKNENEYYTFKQKYSKVNKLFSLSELDPFICYNTPLFNNLFHLFEIFRNTRTFPYFYDDTTFNNFIQCLNNYYCLFCVDNYLKLYYFTKNNNPEYLDVLVSSIIYKMKDIEAFYLIQTEFEIVKPYINKSFLLNLNIEDDSKLTIECVPVHVWSFLYSIDKLYTNRLLFKMNTSQNDSTFFDHLENIREAFNVVDNLENF